MTDNQKAIDETLKQRKYSVEKIDNFKNKLNKNFDELTSEQLSVKATTLKDLYDKYELKCVALYSLVTQSETKQEDEEIESMCEVLKSKIMTKINAISKHNSESSANAAPPVEQMTNVEKSQPEPKSLPELGVLMVA